LSLGFGLEKAGLLALRGPKASLVAIVLLSAACVLGILQLQTGGDLSSLFRADNPVFHKYEELNRNFPTSEFDILLAAEAENVANPDILENLRTLHLELEFGEAVAGVVSMFSIRGKPDEQGYAPPIVPDELPEGEEFDKLMDILMEHPLVGGKFLSENKSDNSAISLMLLSLNNKKIKEIGLGKAVDEIKQIAREAVENTRISVQFAGVPIMRNEIRQTMASDRLVFNIAGFSIGTIICWLFFRRFVFMFIASLPPLLATAWTLGILGFSGQSLNIFINVIPPLVMVIAFSDAMHMVFAIRRRLDEGDDRVAAARHAVQTVGPACALTSLTTSLALLSLGWTDSGLIREFGMSAALGTMLAYVAVIFSVPTMAVLLLKDPLPTSDDHHRHSNQISGSMAAFCSSLGEFIYPRHPALALLGAFLLVLFSIFHFQLEPRYRLSDQVPDNQQSITTIEKLDKQLSGAHPVHVLIKWSQGSKLTSDRTLGVIAKAHTLMESVPEVGNVWSITSLQHWLANYGGVSNEKLAAYIEKMPAHLKERFLNQPERSALVTGRIRNVEAATSAIVFEKIDRELAKLRKEYPEMELSITGLTVVSAKQSSAMIAQLNQSLIIAVLIVIAIIGVAFRSFGTMFFSLLPNLLPVVSVGAVLFLTGEGLQYASIMGLTVAFGLAVDDTIHFLHRLHIEQGRSTKAAEAIGRTLERVGPVLVLTTTVLVCGLSVTMLSELPVTELFGKLMIATLIAALIGDLLILPAFILSVQALRKYGAEFILARKSNRK
jgi:predicted RND superfamily exporter protein